uniref:endonuclease/exonuclease/phosphatase family protein n=1 Tax=uncultured Fusobacterium sp. TaxID=159267 RepID=UPI0035A64B71
YSYNQKSRCQHTKCIGAQYSWWSYRFNARKNNAGWRIDYFLVSERLKDSLENAEIHKDILGSDHCPVVLKLKENF